MFFLFILRLIYTQIQFFIFFIDWFYQIIEYMIKDNTTNAFATEYRDTSVYSWKLFVDSN